MIIKIKPGASQGDIDYVIGRAHSLGLDTHISQDDGQTLISLLGDIQTLTPTVFRGLRGVAQILPLRSPFRLVSRDFQAERSVVVVGGVPIGGEQIAVIAGPCAVESQQQLLTTARTVKEAGARILRGGAFKPRTSPYSFRGMGEEGLKLLAAAREETGLPIVTEVMAPEHVPLVSRYADMLQIGARNMQNFELLDAAGKSQKPVLLKRGMMATLEELLFSAEYILSHGNHHVVLCERGIRTFEPYSRNTLDITAVPILQGLTHLPVIVDPSHATGKADLVAAVSRAAVAVGADGLIIEVHPEPERALSDGPQSLTPQRFAALMVEARRVAPAVGRTI
ncbi:MAG TPA: 3-deoxy-7-phosphoheptulonate synthase [bacterium]|jgi:3-deoxy-7-phosphoheptulonate synthase|nr:3-deoxy-7-phosphoheptulonate synthase [bacterium]